MAKAKSKSKATKSLEKMVRASSRQVRKPSTEKPAKKDPQQSFVRLHELVREHGKTLQKIPIAMISMGENVRQSYGEAQLKVLAQSLEKDGLIQYPSVCLKNDKIKGYHLVCRNGHRRILAAQMLGWQSIDAIVMSLDTAADELYHTINANLSEDVFYLDLALAYDQAHQLGESDEKIAARVGVNPRTVGWYRRLAAMPASCSQLVRQHPDLFTATWAIQLARKGELPQETLLLAKMKDMVVNQARQGATSQEPSDQKARLRERREAKKKLQQKFAAMPEDERQAIQTLLRELAASGFVTGKALSAIEKHLLTAGPSRRSGRTGKMRS